MGKSLARGLLKMNWRVDQIVMADRFEDTAIEAQGLLGVTVLLDAAAAIEGRETIVVAVKPDDVSSLLEEIAGVVTADQIVVSLVAGVPISALELLLPDIPVVRTMPNTPASIGEAITAYCGGDHADEQALEKASAVLSAVGDTIQVDEDDLDAVTAVSGSGPAYVFLLAETLMEAAIREGLSEETSERLVTQTLVGSGLLLRTVGKTATELRSDVTSPGGTTAAALNALERGGFDRLIMDAVRAARIRSNQLGEVAPRSAQDGG